MNTTEYARLGQGRRHPAKTEQALYCELRPEQRRDALVLVAEHAAAGRLTVEHRVTALTAVTDAWTSGGPGRIVLTP